MDSLKRQNIRLLTILGILIGILVLIACVHGAEFNLTCNASEKYLLWQFDNGTYNISVDGSNSTSFTGEGYLVTNLRPNTMHLISIESGNTSSDYCTTDKTFWDTDYFFFMIIGIFLLLIGTRFPIATVISWIPLIASLYAGWAIQIGDWYMLLSGFLLMLGAFRWYAQS